MSRTLITDFPWNESDIFTFLPVSLTLVFFIFFWFTSKSEIVKSYFYRKFTPDMASASHITFNRILGFVTLGIFPGVICLIFLPGYTLADYGLTYRPETLLMTIGWTLGLSLIVIPLGYLNGKKPKNLINYPQIRAKIWNNKIVVMNAVSWAFYLLGYEFLFRGIMLTSLTDHIGVWPAISINIALYSGTHIPKGLDETIGAIPLGLVLCLLTLASGTIWIAFIVHVALTWANSFTALKFHPEMHYRR